MTSEVSLAKRSVHRTARHPDVARGGHLVFRRAAYTAFLSSVLFGSFFITLWLTEPQVPNAPDNHLLAERLAAKPISSSSDLAKSGYEAHLTPSQRLSGHVDASRRIDEQKVGLTGRAADGGETALANAPTPGLGIQVRGSAEAVTIEARDASVEDVLAALSRAFDMDYQSSIDLNKRLYGTYIGPLSQVLTRILQGYNFVLKTDNRRMVVTVTGTPHSLVANPSPPGLSASGAPPAPAPAPQQSGAPAPASVPQQSGAPAPAPVPQQPGAAAPAPVPQPSGAPAPAPVPQPSGAPAPAPVPQPSGAPTTAPVPQGLGSATMPAPGSASAPVVGPKL
jgi:hypothetical protein